MNMSWVEMHEMSSQTFFFVIDTMIKVTVTVTPCLCRKIIIKLSLYVDHLHSI